MNVDIDKLVFSENLMRKIREHVAKEVRGQIEADGYKRRREHDLAVYAKQMEALVAMVQAHAVGVQNVYNRLMLLEQMVKNRLRIEVPK